MTRQLLTECHHAFQPIQISESVSGGQRTYKLQGLFHLAETKNANGRIYSRRLLEREVKNIMPSIKARAVTGELDHPIDPMPKLKEAACVITNLKMDGNKVLGELEAIKTHYGQNLRGLIESGVKLGISSRGVGSLIEKDGIKHVNESDYQLLTWDVVANPSTPDAWLGEEEDIFLSEDADAMLWKNRHDLWQGMSENTNEIVKFQKEHKISKDDNAARKLLQGLDELFGGK